MWNANTETAAAHGGTSSNHSIIRMHRISFCCININQCALAHAERMAKVTVIAVTM